MYIWVAIDIDNQLREQKELVKEIEKEIKFNQSNVSALPLHISLKISSNVSKDDENKLRDDIKGLFESMHSFNIETDALEQNETIIWIKMKENEELKYLHDKLCDIYTKYGMELHEYDNCFVFHATLFLDNDKSKIDQAYEKIKNIELPTKLIAKRFIIGSSSSGDIGTYSVDTIIENN